MKSRKILKIALITLVAGSAFLALGSSRLTGSAPASESCKESLEQCSKKKDAGGADKMIWETLSQQFFSSL